MRRRQAAFNGATGDVREFRAIWSSKAAIKKTKTKTQTRTKKKCGSTTLEIERTATKFLLCLVEPSGSYCCRREERRRWNRHMLSCGGYRTSDLILKAGKPSS
ncbi:hypothetical protein BHE74_00044909 [Ensete ventricosum]|nr:hypothetical protein BHE74_00044909 [Ensete ventricosum]